MRPVLDFLVLLLIATTVEAHRQTQLKSFFEIFELETVSFGKRTRSDDCLGAPYLYVTFGHYEASSVSKYTRDGCFISDNILVGGHDSEMDLRSMAIDGKGELLIANAAFGHSQVLLYGACDDTNTTTQMRRHDLASIAATNENAGVSGLSKGQREFKGIITDHSSNPGAVHPYGIALDADQARPLPKTHARVFIDIQGLNSLGHTEGPAKYLRDRQLRYHAMANDDPRCLSVHACPTAAGIAA
jgi:hypothetical protein